MITCPRCGGLAPDGSPWCPHCGYGRPQAPIVYQPPQSIPARYDIVDLPPSPKPHRLKKKKRKKSGYLKAALALFGALFGLIILSALISSGSEPEPTATPNLETLVSEMMDQAGTKTAIAVLSATPTFTLTPTFTATFTMVPTYTPYPTYTPFPEVPVAPSYTGPLTYSDNSYAQSAPGIRGSVAPETSYSACVVKGSKTGKYHCSNSPNFDTMKDYVCFSSEAEAIAAGYEMSGNMHGWCQQ